MRRVLPWFVVVALAGALGPACGTSAKGTDACRAIESARCDKRAQTGCDPTFAVTYGDAASCAHFYDAQCGRGLQDGTRDPTKAELDRCIAAIKGSCSIANEPTSAPECAVFLTPPAVPVADTGVDTAPGPDGATDTDGDGG